MFDRMVLITRKTRLEELIERFNTRAQAKFYIEHASGDFSSYVAVPAPGSSTTTRANARRQNPRARR